ncbi:Elongin-A [Coemansia sp. RSA 1086]|nr:Elongin-A [Coemansia sp. RSA 1086]
MNRHPRREQHLGILSLKDLCVRTLRANVHRIGPLGTTPRFLISEVLEHCSAEQLERIEHFNPHIVPENDALWMAHGVDKYDELRELHNRIEQKLEPPVASWRTLYREAKRRSELRARQIMERVRRKTAEIERKHSARTIKVTRPIVHRGGRVAPRAESGSSLMHDAWVKARAHMQMLERPCGSRNARPRPFATQPAKQSAYTQPTKQPAYTQPTKQPAYTQPTKQPTHAPYFRQTSPAGSPAQSPPSSYSPPHSSYSPPHVPDACAYGTSSYSPKFSVIEDPFDTAIDTSSSARSAAKRPRVASSEHQRSYIARKSRKRSREGSVVPGSTLQTRGSPSPCSTPQPRSPMLPEP